MTSALSEMLEGSENDQRQALELWASGVGLPEELQLAPLVDRALLNVFLEGVMRESLEPRDLSALPPLTLEIYFLRKSSLKGWVTPSVRPDSFKDGDEFELLCSRFISVVTASTDRYDVKFQGTVEEIPQGTTWVDGAGRERPGYTKVVRLQPVSFYEVSVHFYEVHVD